MSDSKKAKKTLFYDKHLACGGKMVDFSGWLLPLEYSGILKETKIARTSCALFDVSHMGRLVIRGKDALPFLEKMTTNNVSALTPGSVQYSLLLNEQAGVVDDLLVYNTKDEYRCVVNASNKDKVWAWLNAHKQGDLDLCDETDSTVLLSLQGPDSAQVLDRIFPGLAGGLAYMQVSRSVCGDFSCLVSRSGYTGEDGFEISTDNEHALLLWDKIIGSEPEEKTFPAGLGSRDILRIEAGYPLYGHEIDGRTNPLESSLAWVIKYKDKDFIGKDKIMIALEQGLKRRRVGLVMKDKGVPRQGYPVCSKEGSEIGTVTSGTYSPNAEKFIAMALVSRTGLENNKDVFVKIRGRMCAAEVTALPHVPYAHK